MCNISAILREKILSCFLTNALANSGGIQSDTIWKRQNCTIGNHRRDMFCMPVLLVSMLIACTSQFGREFGREFVCTIHFFATESLYGCQEMCEIV